MGSTPNGRPTNPAGVGIRNPQELEPVQSASGLWWLAPSGDLERIAIGTFGSEETAAAHRQWLVDRATREATPNDWRASCLMERKAGDDLARRISEVCIKMCSAISIAPLRCGEGLVIPSHVMGGLYREICESVNGYHKAVDHG